MTKEEAIKILKAIRVYECYPKSAGEETKEALDIAIEALSERNIARDIATILENEQDMRVMLQNADRPKGEWIPHTTSVGLKHYAEYARCSECGEMALVHMNFCPNCGADMRGDKHETD